MERAATVAVDALSHIADTELHQTSSLYKDGLRDAITTKGGALTIALTGVTKDLEVGYPARDMKSDLLNSPSAKQGKSGKYIDIPFRHQLSQMPAAVKAAVQSKVKAERSAARAENRPEKSPMRVTGKMPGGTNAQERIQFLRSKSGKHVGTSSMIHLVKHKTSILSDMVRTKVGTSGQYGTMRRISANSDPQSWFHPGFKGIHALKRVTPDLRRTMRDLYKQEFRKTRR